MTDAIANTPDGDFDPKDLRPEELSVLECVAKGKWKHFDDTDATPKAVIRADFIRHLMLQLPVDDKAWPMVSGGIRLASLLHDDGVRITGAHIKGRLDLRDGRSTSGGALPVLALEYCDFDQPIELEHAWLQRLSLEGARLRGIMARGLRLDGPCNLNGVGPLSVDAASDTAVANFSLSRVDGDIFLGDTQFVARRNEKGEYESAAVNFYGAKISGGFWANKLFAEGGLNLTDVDIDGTVALYGARLDRPEGSAFTAVALRCGDIIASSTTDEAAFIANGTISLSKSMIRGELDMSGARLLCPGGLALIAEGMTIEGSCMLRGGFRAEGLVSLLTATIKTSIDMVDARFINPGKKAIVADGITIGSAWLLRDGFRAEGEFRALNATIRGSFEASNGHFINRGGIAIIADGITIDNACLFRSGFRAEGRVQLLNATIGGTLEADDGAFVNPDDMALNMANATIRGDVSFDNTVIDGAVTLAGAHSDQSLCVAVNGDATTSWVLTDTTVTRLNDAGGKGWGGKARIYANGFRYQFLGIRTSAAAWLERRAWLKQHLEWNPELGPQPYEQIARVFTQMGHAAAARQVLVHLIRRESREDLGARSNGLGLYLLGLPITLLRSLLMWLFGACFGYGYSPGKALVTVTCLILLGWAGANYANTHGLMALNIQPVDSVVIHRTGQDQFAAPFAADGRTEMPCGGAISPFWYAVDSFIPLVDMGQDSKCELALVAPPSDPVVLGHALPLFDSPLLLRTLQALYTLAGTLATSLMVLTFSGVLHRKLRD